MRTIKVLIVEDEPIIAADLEDRLKEMGYDTTEPCASGEEALSVVMRESIDLILMDIQLEGALDGIETARLLQAKYPLPIIFLTSNADEATFNRAKTINPAAFLSKPFRGKDLKHAIELAIARASLLQDAPEPTAATDQPNTYLFTDRLFVKIKDRMVRVFFSDILWFEADDYYCKMYTYDKDILIGQTLKQMGEALANHTTFMRVHRSYIVNLNHMEEIGDLFVRIGKKQIPLNKAAKDELVARLQKI